MFLGFLLHIEGTQVSVDLVLVARSCSRLRGQKPYNVIKIVESCLHHCIGTELKIVEAAIPVNLVATITMAAGDHGYHYSRLDDGSVTVPQEAQMALAEAAPTPSAIALVGIDGASMARSFTGTVPPDSAASAVIWLWDQPLREAAKQRTRDAPPAVMYVEISAALRNGKQREGSENLKLLITALLSCSLVVQPAPPTSMATSVFTVARDNWCAGALLEEWIFSGTSPNLS